MKLNITQNLMLYFTTLLVIFALIVGLIFSTVFTRQTQSYHIEQLEHNAVNIASKLSGAFELNSNYQNPYNYGNRGGYGFFLHILDEMDDSKIWIVNRDAFEISVGENNGNVEYNELPSEAQSLIKSVFEGGIITSKSFGSFLGTPSVSVGAPIIDSQGYVVAAVVLHKRISDMNVALENGIKVLLLSLCAALLIGLLAAVLLSRRFTYPLRRIEKTTVALADGNYDARTEVNRSDEIGSLAKNTDTLAKKLEIASNESEQLEQMRRDYISNISHELRTPVTVIRGSLEALCDGVIGDEKIDDYHSEMLKESINLEHMVNDLLELSRLQNANYLIEFVTMNLLDALGDAVRSVRHIANEKQIEIISDFGNVPCIIEGDYHRLRQMFIAVLDNAVKFSDKGKSINVTVNSTENGEFCISITDHGIGIPQEDIPHIFDRFFKSSDEKNGKGTGLGLAIAKQIADRHGITITVTSTKQEATVFNFRVSSYQ